MSDAAGDSLDIAGERTQLAIDARVAAIRANAQIPAGVAGECDLCGEWSGRLIGGACAPCRDKYRLRSKQ